jgi:hypothetical protein
VETEWLLDEILNGLQKLFCLSLDRTPAAEMLPGTASAWLEAITDGLVYDRGRDANRLRRGFVILAKTVRRWPSPVEYLEAVPKYEAPAIGYETKPVSEEQAAANIARLKSMLTGVTEPVAPAKIERETTPEQREVIEADLRQHYTGKMAAAGSDA